MEILSDVPCAADWALRSKISDAEAFRIVMKRTVNVVYKALSDLRISDHRFRSRCKTELIKILNLGSEIC